MGNNIPETSCLSLSLSLSLSQGVTSSDIDMAENKAIHAAHIAGVIMENLDIRSIVRNTAIGAVGVGAIVGGIAGSIVPGPGTALGVAVGGAAGAALGLGYSV